MSQISPSSTGLRIVQIKPDSCKSKPMVTNLLNWSCRPSSRRLTSRTRWARSSTSATSWSRTRWRVWKMENGWDLLIEPSIYLRAISHLLEITLALYHNWSRDAEYWIREPFAISILKIQNSKSNPNLSSFWFWVDKKKPFFSLRASGFKLGPD